MKNQWDETKEFLVTFSDAKRILSKAKKKIAIAALVFASLGLAYALTKPVTYEITATFREKTSAGQSGNDERTNDQSSPHIAGVAKELTHGKFPSK